MTDRPEETLDPENWTAMRKLGHRMLDDMFTYLETVRERPVWQPMPEEVKAHFQTPVPQEPQGAEHAYRDFFENVLAYPMGNIHPRFFAWVMGNGTALGMLAEMLAAAVNSDVSGGNHAPQFVEHQVINWCKQIMGFPSDASGLLVAGTSVANLIALTVARNSKADANVRQQGTRSLARPLTLYASRETHSSIQKAVEILGLGNQALRRIPTDADFRIDIAALENVIAADRTAGCHPFCIVGNAGTVNTGSFDDLNRLADIAQRQQIWFHVDGAFGAMTALSPALRSLVAGMERADSLAFDLHKWLSVPFEAGCVLVRSEKTHRNTFSLVPDYLAHGGQRGLTGGPNWFDEYGIQHTQGFRALKVWMSLKEHGVRKYGRLIEQNVRQACYLAALIDSNPQLQRLAPVMLNIVNFRFVADGLDEAGLAELNKELLLRLHESGKFAPSSTVLNGQYALRVAISNHRSRREDFEEFVRETVRVGEALAEDLKTEAGRPDEVPTFVH